MTPDQRDYIETLLHGHGIDPNGRADSDSRRRLGAIGIGMPHTCTTAGWLDSLSVAQASQLIGDLVMKGNSGP